MGEGARDAVTGTPLPARPGGSGDASRAETRQIRTEIERTRADLGETIDAIQDRLRPAQIAKDAKERVKDVTRQGMRKVSRQATRIAGEVAAAGRDTTDIVVERVRTRPMPFALAGAGVGALFAARAFRKRPSRQRPVEEETWQDRERRATDWSPYPPVADEWAESTPAAEASSSRSGESGPLRRMIEQNPLAFGLAAVAAGVVVGLTIPRGGPEGPQHAGEYE